MLRSQETYYDKISTLAPGTQDGVKQVVNSFFSYCMEREIGDPLTFMKKTENGILLNEELHDSISKLIEEEKGDTGRLNHILESLEKGKQLYSSDQKYLQSLIPSSETIISEKKKQIETKVETRKVISSSETYAFRGKYLGGHPLHPKPQKITLFFHPDKLVLQELEFELPYRSIKSIENTTEEKIKALRVVGLGLIWLPLGIAGLFWKKKKIFTHLVYQDEVGMNASIILDFEKNLEEVQREIYTRAVAARKKS